MPKKNDTLLSDLNTAQLAAVTHRTGPLLVVAGAGTGKTTVISRRIAWLIREKLAKPEEILALTFTDKAAAEMEARVDVLVPYGYTDMWVMTFHAFGERLLRRHAIELGISSDFSLLSQVEQAIFLKRHLWNFQLKHYRPLANPTKHIQAFIQFFSRLKDEDVSSEELATRIKNYKSRIKDLSNEEQESEIDHERWEELANAYQTYNDFLRGEDKLDFGDLLMLTLALLRERPDIRQNYQKRFKYILIDEFQDTNHAQHELLRFLAGEEGNITVVGDDDQAIYAFRGAALDNILEFRDTYARTTTIVLNQNYRSSQTLLDASYRLIQQNNPHRLEAKYNLPKRLTGRADGHQPSVHYEPTGTAEVETVIRLVKEFLDKGRQPKDIAVLARAHSHLAPFEQALIKAGINVTSQERGLYEQPHIRECIFLLKVLAYPTDSQNLALLATSSFYELSPRIAGSLNHLSKRRNRPIIHLTDHLSQYTSELELDKTAQDILAQLKNDLETYQAMATNHNVGEVLYDFLRAKGILRTLTQTIEGNELRIRQLVAFFGRITRFIQTNPDQSVTAFVDNLNLLTEFGDDPKLLDPDPDVNAVHLLTVHAAKGLEFPVVFLCNTIVDRFPSRGRHDPIEIPPSLLGQNESTTECDEHLAEERRLFYVAMTRAKEELIFTLAADYGGSRLRKPSPFLLEALDLPSLPSPVIKTQLEEQLSLFAPTFGQVIKPVTGKKKPVSAISALTADGTLMLTVSKIEDYLDCPAKFRAIHLLHLPIIQSHAMVYGIAIHQALAAYNLAKLEGRGATYALLRDTFTKAWLSEGFLSREHEDQRFNLGLTTLRTYFEHDQLQPKKPIAVEEAFRFPYAEADKVTINGRYDCIYEISGGGVEITDYKTSHVTEEKTAIKKAKDSLQLMVYAMAYQSVTGNLPSLVSLHFVENGLLGQFQPTDAQLVKAKSRINDAIDGIRSGYFGPGKGSHSCEWCSGLSAV